MDICVLKILYSCCPGGPTSVANETGLRNIQFTKDFQQTILLCRQNILFCVVCAIDLYNTQDKYSIWRAKSVKEQTIFYIWLKLSFYLMSSIWLRSKTEEDIPSGKDNNIAARSLIQEGYSVNCLVNVKYNYINHYSGWSKDGLAAVCLFSDNLNSATIATRSRELVLKLLSFHPCIYPMRKKGIYRVNVFSDTAEPPPTV